MSTPSPDPHLPLLRCPQCGSVYAALDGAAPVTLQRALWACEACASLESWRPRESLRTTGVIVTMRLTACEFAHLRDVAAQSDETMSDVIREALYEWYGIGDLHANSLSAASLVAVRAARGAA
jgi:hypothetical protein